MKYLWQITATHKQKTKPTEKRTSHMQKAGSTTERVYFMPPR